MNEIAAWQFGGLVHREGLDLEHVLQLSYLALLAVAGGPVVHALDVLQRPLFQLWVRQGYADHAAESRR